MRTEFPACFPFHYIPFTLAEEATDKVIIIYLTQEADALAVTAAGSGQPGRAGNIPYFLLHQSPQREHEFRDLQIVNLSQEVGLVFYRVYGCTQPYLAILINGSGIMSGGGEVKLFPYFLLEATEFDEPVAHHIRIGSPPATNFINSIGSNLFPVLFLQVYHFKMQAITAGNGRSHFPVFLGRAIHKFGTVHSYLDIE